MKKLLNKKRKGFTLVELLVVIAILAVLATVSVVGYTSFIGKANNSNALTECKQAEELVLSDLISVDSDEVRTCGDVAFSYNPKSGRIIFEDSDSPTGGDFNEEFKKNFKDMEQIEGKFAYIDGVIQYTTKNGKGFATWVSGQMPISGSVDENKAHIDSAQNEENKEPGDTTPEENPA